MTIAGAKLTMAEPLDVAEIAVLVYPGAQMAAVHGLTDLFAVANRMVLEQPDANLPLLRITHWSVATTSNSVARIFDSQPSLSSHPVAVLIPPSLCEMPAADSLQVSANWIVQQHKAGAIIGSVCVGAFLLAQTGLLSGRTITTHWTQGKALSDQFPLLKVDVDKPMIDDGDLITTAGLMAWAELGLRVVQRVLGPSIAMTTARFLAIDQNIGARCGGNFSPILNHGDQAVLKVQHWLQGSGALDVSVGDMANQAHLEQRTFLRRFRSATGLKPTEYCQHLRVGKAREMLEFTTRTVDHIAWAVGYQDPGAFRSIFKKITGFSPSDYRGRYGPRISNSGTQAYIRQDSSREPAAVIAGAKNP
ncbi:MAG: AraC family transcriptional regulator [Pseudomonas sp.]|nr:AraC family transcriptional regulator [Pseudomonas sp.]